QESLDPRPEQPTLDLEPWPTPVALRVDDEDATGADGDVVDVRLRAGDPTVVEHAHAAVHQAVEATPEQLLSPCSGGPRRRALGVVGERQDHARDPGMRGAHPLLPPGAPPLVLAPR